MEAFSAFPAGKQWDSDVKYWVGDDGPLWSRWFADAEEELLCVPPEARCRGSWLATHPTHRSIKSHPGVVGSLGCWTWWTLVGWISQSVKPGASWWKMGKHDGKCEVWILLPLLGIGSSCGCERGWNHLPTCIVSNVVVIHVVQSYLFFLSPSIPKSLFEWSPEEINRYWMGDYGPLWDRWFSEAEEEELCPWLKAYLEKHGAERVMVGHTPQRRITDRCDGKLWLLDVMNSRFMRYPGCTLGALVIGAGVYAVYI